MFLVNKQDEKKKKNRKTHNHPNHHGHLQSIKTDLGEKNQQKKSLFSNKTKNITVFIVMQSGRKGNQKIRIKSQNNLQKSFVLDKY